MIIVRIVLDVLKKKLLALTQTLLSLIEPVAYLGCRPEQYHFSSISQYDGEKTIEKETLCQKN